jgi:hypothetical protein
MSVPASFYLSSLVFCIILVLLLFGLLAATQHPFLMRYVYFQIVVAVGLVIVVVNTMWTIVSQARRTQRHLGSVPYAVSNCPDYWEQATNTDGKVMCQETALTKPGSNATPQSIVLADVGPMTDQQRCTTYAGNGATYPWVDLRKACDRLNLTA